MSKCVSCDYEIKIYEFLLDLRKNKPTYYEQVKRIFNYLYKTVKHDFFVDEIKKYSKKDNSSSKEMDKFEQPIFSAYVESNDGIVNNLIKLVYEEPVSFEYFYKQIKPFFEMSELNIYSNYYVFQYIFFCTVGT